MERGHHRKGTHRTIYFQHSDLDMIDQLDERIAERKIRTFSTYVQEAVREKFKREKGK